MGVFVQTAEAVRMLSFPNDVMNLKAILERRVNDVCNSSKC